MQPDPLRYRLLNNGNVFAYPDEQSSKTDVLLYKHEEAFQRMHKLQFKTAQRLTNASGFLAHTDTKVGRDETSTRLTSNTYKTGDNDVYVVVLDDEVATSRIPNTVLVWECSEAWMKAHKLLDITDESGSTFAVYTGIEKYDEYGRTLGTTRNSYWRDAMNTDGIEFHAYTV